VIAPLIRWASRLERHTGLLALMKLGNVALAMLWGFVVTFVFVRILPIEEFRSFLLLVAFANFTVSAELGLTAIAYARLRRARVGEEVKAFDPSEVVALLWILTGLVALGAVLIVAAMATGWLNTAYPGLFLAFYVVAAFNLLTLLARRALAAIDHNLWWEALDSLRRLSGIILLFAALGPISIMASVLIQLVVAFVVLWAGLATFHASLGMASGAWLSPAAGLAKVRTHYLTDFGRTGVLTLCDVGAYNAPYFTIAAITADPRPLLLFDLVFKLSRALSASIRAVAETVLPKLTRAAYQGDGDGVRSGILRCTAWALAITVAASVTLLVAGKWVATIIFDGNLDLQYSEIYVIIGLLFGLSLICVSVYLQWGLGRFGSLMRPSMLLLSGSLLTVPLSLPLHDGIGWTLSAAFLALYASVHLALGGLHGGMLLRMTRSASGQRDTGRGKP
jgi:O-antigen/teichoic acid export membrane protein